MKKALNITYMIAMMLVMVAILFGMLRFRTIFRILALVGLMLFLAGSIIFLIKPGLYIQRAYQFSDDYNSRRKTYNVGVMVGVIVSVIGVLFKLFHIHILDFLVPAGLVIIIFFFIFLYALAFNRKKYIVSLNPSITVNGDKLQQYAGKYYCEVLNENMDVWADGNQLMARLGEQPSFPLSAIKEDVFNYLESGVVIEFAPGKNQLTLIQAGRYLIFVK